MLATLLGTLFTASALLAIATIVDCWRRYGRAAMALHADMSACEHLREVRVRVREVDVRQRATVLQGDFKRRGPNRLQAPARAAVPAAA